MTHQVTITEEQRQMILLALAELSLARPGWSMALREIAAAHGGALMFDQFVQNGADEGPR